MILRAFTISFSLLSLFLTSLTVQASPRGEAYFYACAENSPSLSPENRRFVCSCEAAIFQEYEGHNKLDSFPFYGTKRECKKVINPLYQHMYEQIKSDTRKDMPLM